MHEMWLPEGSYDCLLARILSGLHHEIEAALIDVGRQPFAELVDALLRAVAATCVLTGGPPDVIKVRLVLGEMGGIWPASLYRDLD